MTLKQNIDEMQKKNFKGMSEEIMRIFQEATEKLIASGLAKKSLKKGDRIPEFTLPTIHGKVVSSKILLKKGPLVISFTRGSWCSYCNLEVAALQKVYSEIKNLGAELISISPSRVEKYSEMETKHFLTFNLLSDKKNKVAKKFGLVFELDEKLRPLYKQMGIDIPEHNGDNSFELPIPATYIVNREGEIIYSYVNPDYTKRAEPSEIESFLKDSKH